MKSLYILATCVLCAVQGDGFPHDLDRWYETQPPAKNTDAWYAANNDTKHEWVVEIGNTETSTPTVNLRDNKHAVSAQPAFKIESGSTKQRFDGDRIAAKVSDGWVVSFDAGEFGSALWWFSPDGQTRHQISRSNAIAFIHDKKLGLLAIERVTVRGVSQGSLSSIRRGQNGQWQSKMIVSFGDEPLVSSKLVDGSLIVATSQRLIKITPSSKKVETLLRDAFWSGLYPNSLVVAPSASIFMGMRHGVAKFEKKDTHYTVSWLMPDKEFAHQKFIEQFR